MHGGTGIRSRTEFPVITKTAKIIKKMRPFDWPPEAACRDVRECKYKPLIHSTVRFVFAFSSIALSACYARRPVRLEAHPLREVQVLSRHALSGLKPMVTAPP